MTLVPAIVVFVLVFLFFSKDVLTTKEKNKKTKTADSQPNISDVLLKYELLHGMEEKG